MPVWIRFSTICICFSTSISRSAACTCSVTPRRSAASCAPRRISTKKGWLSVLSTSATVGLPLVVVVVPRLHDTESAAMQTARSAAVLFLMRGPFGLQGSRRVTEVTDSTWSNGDTETHGDAFDGRREATRTDGSDRENEHACFYVRAHFHDPIRPC